jgi:hypothetical protein
VEPFEAETLVFKNALVIDARITNELKKHEVVLRRTFPFEVDDFNVERNATVQIVDDSGNSINFQEAEAGKYVSRTAFAAQPNVGYKLLITTRNGNSYESEMVVTPSSTEIAEVSTEIAINDANQEGIKVVLTNLASDTRAKYFRYEYEETYKIIAPFYNPFEFDVIDSLYFQENDNDDIEIAIKPRIEESQFCYGFEKGNDLILRDSEQNVNNTTGKFEIRFLENNDFKISHRYSILVKQFNLSVDAYSYYSTLDEFTSDESVFTDTQPGFLEGNISAIDDDEIVLGYFEVATVNQERVFFNYTDFFPDRALPPYIINCQLTNAPLLISFIPHVGPGFVVDESEVVSPLLEGISQGIIAYHDTNEDYEEHEGTGEVDGLGPYFVKATGCIDCREYGNNVKPNFWID